MGASPQIDPIAAKLGGVPIAQSGIDPIAAKLGGVPVQEDLTAQNALIDKMQSDAANPTFSQRFVETMGIPTSLDEAKGMGKELLKNAATGGMYGAFQATKAAAKGIYEGGKELGNAMIAQDQGKGSTLENVANAAHGVAHGVAQSIPVVGAPAEQVVSDASKGNVGAAAGTLTALGLQGAALHAVGVEKASEDAKTTVREGYEKLIQSISSGRKPDFPDTIQRLSENGHLKEFATQYEPQTVKEGADAIREYMNDWEKKTINPAVERSPGVSISGNQIAKDVSGLRNPILDKIFTDNPKIISEEAARYAGKDIPLSDIFGPNKLLAKLNAMSKAVQNMSPENKAAAENASVAKAAIDKVTASVREQAYQKLADLGDPGMADAQRDYGAMREFQEVLNKNVSRAELAEAKKPGYAGVPLRAMTRHPLLTGSLALGSEYMHNPLPLAALPVIETLETYKARAATPNAMFRKAMAHFASGPELQAPAPLPRRLPANTPSTVAEQQAQSENLSQTGLPQSWADPKLRMLYGTAQPALPAVDYTSKPGDIDFSHVSPKRSAQELLQKAGFERNEQGKYVRVKPNVTPETLPPVPTEPILAGPERGVPSTAAKNTESKAAEGVTKLRASKFSLTKNQAKYLVEQVREQSSSLPTEKASRRDNPNGYDLPMAGKEIKVPGDGTFRLPSQEAASTLHQRLTGKPLPGIPPIKGPQPFSGGRIAAPRGTPAELNFATVLKMYGSHENAIRQLQAQVDAVKSDPDSYPGFNAYHMERVIQDLKDAMPKPKGRRK